MGNCNEAEKSAWTCVASAAESSEEVAVASQAKLKPLPEQRKFREQHVKDAVKTEKVVSLAKKWSARRRHAALLGAISKWRSATLYSAVSQIELLSRKEAKKEPTVPFASPSSARKRRRTWMPWEEQDCAPPKSSRIREGALALAKAVKMVRLRRAFRAIKLGLGILDEGSVVECDKILSQNAHHPAVSAFLQELRISAAVDDAALAHSPAKKVDEKSDAGEKDAEPMKSSVIAVLKKTCEVLDKRFKDAKATNAAHAERLAAWKARYSARDSGK